MMINIEQTLRLDRFGNILQRWSASNTDIASSAFTRSEEKKRSLFWEKEYKKHFRRSHTGMGAQMTSESISPPTSVAAEGALEGFFACVQLDVSQQVSLLGKRDATLVALEWPVTYQRKSTLQFL